MSEIKFTLRIADSRWVGSPTTTVTDNSNLAGVFTAADDESAAELRQAMERLHGPLEMVPWRSKRTDALTRHVENVALMEEAQDPFAGAEVLYAYTRKDALADGIQIDVSEVAREAGLKFRVFFTRAVWESCVRVPDGVRCQDEKGRLWDIVWMLRCAARRTSGPQMLFGLHVRNDKEGRSRFRDERPPLHLRRGNRRPNQPDKRGIRPFRHGGSKAMNVPPLITYPARPIQGGRLELAPPKRGVWYAEPILNGWRALIHTPTCTMWNRHGALLTIADCFRPALAALAKLADRGLVWADCEALERRHNLGRGTLVVLDSVPESGTPSDEQRRGHLEALLSAACPRGSWKSRLNLD